MKNYASAMAAEAKPEDKVFHPSVFPMVIAIVGPGLALVIVFCLVEGFEHLSYRGAKTFFLTLEPLFLGTIGLAVLGATAAWLVRICFPVKLDDSSVHGHSFWGVRRSIRWQDIEKAMPYRYLNLKFLRLYSGSDATPVWIALFQSHQQEFEDEMRKLAPPENPIHAFLNLTPPPLRTRRQS